jgi:catechol 2,3-dioxygenase-like lactoylglutathione lyase family enzyme
MKMKRDLTTMNHIGINFPDINAAVGWYRDVLGCFVLSEPTETVADNTHYGQLVTDIFGAEFGSVKIAHLSTACGIGIEMFQFMVPKTYVPQNTFDYSRSGIFHICLTTSDLEQMADAVQKSGGKILSKRWKMYDGEKLHLVYCQDPWGTIIEFYDAPYAHFVANRS